jgi:hypothetical protein
MMARKKESIYMQRWLSFHPYPAPQQSDYYYLKLCNEIYKVLEYGEFPDEEIQISDEQKKDLACFITCYFEDVISGPGLWHAFITQVKELYGTYLPFFDPDPEEYYAEEINPEDIHFLLWYYLSMIFRDDSVISPSIYEWSEHSEQIFEILEREYEEAPESFNLKQFFRLSPGELDFYLVRDKLKWIMLDSWLHFFQGQELREMTEHMFRGDEDDPVPEEARAGYLYDTADSFILMKHTPLLARRGNEWMAYTLGKDHPLHESLLEMGEKKSGFFFYMGKQGDNLLFQHIASGTELSATTKSMEVPPDVKPGRSVTYSGFVKWRNEWWFSGAQLAWGEDNELIRNEKESEESGMLFGKNPAVKRKENGEIYKSFMKFNQGNPMAFVENSRAAEEFIQDFLAHHNKSLMKSLQTRSKGRKIFEPNLIPEIEQRIPDSEHSEIETIPGMLYCDPDTGIELVFGHNDLIPDPRNKWHTADPTEEDLADGTLRMLESKHISGNWMKYLVSNYDLPGLGFPGLSGQVLLMDNIDFMLRFWKREGYFG